MILRISSLADIVLLFPASAAQNGISAAIHTQYEKAYVTIHDIRLGLLVRDRVSEC